MSKSLMTLILILAIISIASAADISPKDIIEKRCTVCHSTNRVYDAKKSKADWESTVVRMISYGAQLNQDEREAVINYLSENK
jgi:cytochrome c2